jgi:cysteine desulfurase family protein (TIGR01976 family)
MKTTAQLPPINDIRAQFPALERKHAGKPVAYFDGPGGTQTPRSVAAAITDYLFHHNANTHWTYPTSAETDAIILNARQAMADLLNAASNEIAFGNNMTTITFHVARALGRQWGPGDEIVVTELDHYGNVSPWRALEQERGLTIRTVPFDLKTGELVWSELEKAVTNKTKLLAIGAASNALGTMSSIREAARLAKLKGALCYIDAVHYAAHGVIDVQDIGCDFLVCSPYKFYGPHTGVIFMRAALMTELDAPKVAPAANIIPERLETGTQNHEGIAGIGAAVEFLASLGTGATRREKLVRAMTALHTRGDELVARLWNGLAAINGVKLFGPPPGRPRTPTISFVVDGLTSSEVAKKLIGQGLFASNGGFYAKDILERYGYSKVGFVRAGCACYTTEDEVDRLIEATKAVAARKI